MSEKWLDELQEKIASCWEWHSLALQFIFRYAKPDEGDDFWEVWAYLSKKSSAAKRTAKQCGAVSSTCLNS